MWGKPSRCCTWCSMSGCAVPVDRRWLRDGFTRHRCKLVLQTGLAVTGRSQAPAMCGLFR